MLYYAEALGMTATIDKWKYLKYERAVYSGVVRLLFSRGEK